MWKQALFLWIPHYMKINFIKTIPLKCTTNVHFFFTKKKLRKTFSMIICHAKPYIYISKKYSFSIAAIPL